MNVNKVLTKDYENKPNWTLGENEPKTKPIKAKQSQFGEDQYKTKDTSLESEVWGLAMPAIGRPGKEKNLPTAGFNG